jgi:hypothetical protein
MLRVRSQVDTRRALSRLRELAEKELASIDASTDETHRRMLEVSLNRMLHAVQASLEQRVVVDPNTVYNSDQVEKLDLELAQQVIGLEDQLIELEERVSHQREHVLEQLKRDDQEGFTAVDELPKNVESQLPNVQVDAPMMANLEAEETLDSIVQLLDQLRNKIAESKPILSSTNNNNNSK